MPLLDKLFGKQEYAVLQPATIPIKSLVAAQPYPLETQFQAHPQQQHHYQQQQEEQRQQQQRQQQYPVAPEAFLKPAIIVPQQQPPLAYPQEQRMMAAAAETISKEVGSNKPIFTGGVSEAPIFIKINQYEEVLTELSTIRASTESFKAAVGTFESLRDMQDEVIGIIGAVVKDIERSQLKLDKILVQMQAIEQRVKRATYDEKPVEKSASVTDLEERIRRLREEIGRLERVP